MSLQLEGDRIALVLNEQDNVRASGLIVVNEDPNKPTTGKVMAVGTHFVLGTEIFNLEDVVGKGDIILIVNKHAGFPLEFEGVKYQIICYRDIIGKVVD